MFPCQLPVRLLLLKTEHGTMNVHADLNVYCTHGGETEGETGTNPVSYTHLTLPTSDGV